MFYKATVLFPTKPLRQKMPNKCVILMNTSDRLEPIPVAARSKACVCSRSLAGIVVSNTDERVDFRLLRLLCVVR